MTTLLVVDDDATIRGLYARALAKLGDVEQAGNGAAALEALAARPFDAITLDLHMPNVDGFKVLQNLRATAGPNRSTPVVVITADPHDKARVDAFEGGAMLYLQKPVPLASLVTMVRMALSKARVR